MPRLHHSIPAELFQWITFLTRAIPLRSIPTFIELLIGCMLTNNGFVCEVWHTLSLQNHWTSYYKWLQQGKWSWIQLGLQLLRLVVHFLSPASVIYLELDDSLIYRKSKKAPAASLYHQHGNKANRPKYAWGQYIVTMAVSVVRDNGDITAIPFLSRLISKTGNGTKISAAKALIRVIQPVLPAAKIRLLVDSWYMKSSLVTAAMAKDWHVIGQARRDLRLYRKPEKCLKKPVGRPRKYGEQLTRIRQEQLPRRVKTWEVTKGSLC
ncbi:IS701 family transposase [Pelagibaculum spongiae]|uniref:Uncharacterized protein n=1 Tax=Pelagibaculum spongiae TaxID=2080658 RepID=A0A2V1GZ64_9GAMM|nr:transposase [Pelagibaculum spongiae]PVZ68285.1 hypothetical protein DC094_13430 [Pelagibaculum spongiae]